MSKAFNTNIDEILNLCESEGNLSGSLSKNKPESNIAAEIQAAKGSSSKIISLLTLRAVQTGGKLNQSDFDKIIQTLGISNDKKRIKDILSICEREGIIQSEDTTPDNTDKPSENDVEEIKPAVEVKSTTVESKPTAPKGVDKTVKGCPPKIVSILTEKAKQTGGKLTWSDLDSILQSLGIGDDDTDEIDEILSICEREGIAIIDEDVDLEDIDISFDDPLEEPVLENIDSDDIETGFSYTRIDSGFSYTRIFSGIRIDKYIGSSEIIIIPKEIEGEPVTYIGRGAFSCCWQLESIIIPDGSTSIGTEAFNNCCHLKNIIIPYSVTFIGEYAFFGCESLTSIIIPEDVTSICKGTFSKCKRLNRIIISESVSSIGEKAFFECTNLIKVERWPRIHPYRQLLEIDCFTEPLGILSNVHSIGCCAFEGCKRLSEITIPDPITSIGDKAFKDCENLTEITIPNGVTTIGKEAFSGCTSLINVTIPNSINSIGNGAFRGCTSLINVTIPNSIDSIGNRTFSGCTSLINVTIPNSINSIGNGAFRGCTSLINVTIPNSIDSIGNRTFSGCKNIKTIYVSNSALSKEAVTRGIDVILRENPFCKIIKTGEIVSWIPQTK